MEKEYSRLQSCNLFLSKLNELFLVLFFRIKKGTNGLSFLYEKEKHLNC